MNWEQFPYYEFNAATGLLLTLSLTALAILMIILAPQSRINKMAMWSKVCLMAVMWRWVAGIFWPQFFGAGESLIASVVFCFAAVINFLFAAVAWMEHIGEAYEHRFHGQAWWETAKRISSWFARYILPKDNQIF